MSEEQPQWQPIEMLPVFEEMIEGIWESTVEQVHNLEQASHKPHVLDDATLSRLIKTFTEQKENHWLFETQFKLWLESEITPSQREHINDLVEQYAELKVATEQVLELAHSISQLTIDKVMAMDDVELVAHYLDPGSDSKH